ncbi:bis(5'-nucleosyl)-tetraphosphatase [Methylophaga sp. OBS4]|uniref:bis(5'-nucleosyl)-tetraphosphatase n=1 Tax=Methylophaga sp. OBS4 TaxID=2991935 RepID=UPI00225BBEB8|nr:NUDIX domain-containing protein [Methylophaga sp. OBS4]MCX4186485.1 NUDIX domain-containing protein [Methylophaga sp. OBS4]
MLYPAFAVAKAMRSYWYPIMTSGRRPRSRRPVTGFSAGVVVVRREKSGWRLLVLRAYRNWDFPKGTREPGETPLTTALRETEEETGITDLAFHWGQDYCETVPYTGSGGRKVARYYLAETAARNIILPVSPQLGRPEHHEWRWVRFSQATKLLPPRLQPVLAWARQQLES